MPRLASRRLSPFAPPFVANGQQTLPVLGQNPIIARAPLRIIRTPHEGGQHGCARGRCGFQHLQRQPHSRQVHVGLPWQATRIAKREIRKDEAWYATMFNNIASGTDNDGWNTRGFEMTCGQTHGLVANWS